MTARHVAALSFGTLVGLVGVAVDPALTAAVCIGALVTLLVLEFSRPTSQPLLYHHDQPIGRVTAVHEDERGVFVEVELGDHH